MELTPEAAELFRKDERQGVLMAGAVFKDHLRKEAEAGNAPICQACDNADWEHWRVLVMNWTGKDGPLTLEDVRPGLLLWMADNPRRAAERRAARN